MNIDRRESVVSAPEPIDSGIVTPALRLNGDKSAQGKVSTFDQFGAHYEGPFDREELYDYSDLR